MKGYNVYILENELSARAYEWYLKTDLYIKCYADDLYVMNGVKYDSYKEVLDKIESMAEEFEKIEKEVEE